MVKKDKKNIIKSIYYDLKEYHYSNANEIYGYQDFETAGKREYKVITKKTHQLENYEKNRLANELMKIFIKEIYSSNELKNVNSFIASNPIIRYYDNFIKLFKEFISNDNNALKNFRNSIIKLIKESAYSEEVKLGLSLAPFCNIEDIDEILEIFSIHNEYLFYTIMAYEHIGKCNNIIFKLAKRSSGYGKVFCVMNLKPITNEIKKWMIEEGADNNVGGTELLSYTMLSLDLLDYLENTEFTKREIELLSKSFSLLFSDYGIEEINDGIIVCRKLLEIIDKNSSGIYSLYAVISILYSIEAVIIEDYKNKRNFLSNRFTDAYKELIETCKEICKKEIWHEIIAKEVSNVEVESSVLISCAEKTQYKLKKKEFEAIFKRDYTNALLYKYAFAVGNKSIKKVILDLGLQKLPLDQILKGQDELKMDNLVYDDIAQICFFILIKYLEYEDYKDKYKELNLQALRAALIETRLQAATNLQIFKDQFDEIDNELINDAISSEMVVEVRRLLNSLRIKTNDKEKKYIEVTDDMHIDIHVKDIYLITVNVSGTRYIDMSEVSSKLFEEDLIYLKREYDNPYDSYAIRVITKEGYIIGYIPRENNYILKNLMDKGKYLYGKINEISEDYNNISIKIYLSYKDVIEEITSTLSLLSGEREHFVQ
ncbi:HIRAN domain-containing protein [Clostridium saccharoperbutylacetonicum]